MKLSNLSSLNKYSVKRIGFFFAFFFILLEILALKAGTIDESNFRLLNVYILGSLLLVAFSKEKVDDERSQKIRYFSLKFTFKFLLASITSNYLLNYNIETIYVAIFSLIIYLVVFNLANYYNPEFIFKEETKKNESSIIAIVIILI